MSLKFVLIAPLLTLALVDLNAMAAQPDNCAIEPAPDVLKHLLATMNERLEIADLVALTKWDSAKPSQDSGRESQVIANAQRQAVQYGIGKDDAGQLLNCWQPRSRPANSFNTAYWPHGKQREELRKRNDRI